MIISLLLIPILLALFLVWRRYVAYRLLCNCGFRIVPSHHWWRGSLDVFLSPSAIFEYGILSKEYGRTYGIMHGGVPVIVTSDVNLIQSITQSHYYHFHARMAHPFDGDPVSNEAVHVFAARGERWKRLRTLTSQAVSASNMKQLYPIIEQSIFSFLDHLELLVGEEAELNMHKTFQNHTSDVLARCAFGQTHSMHSDNIYHRIFSNTFGNEPQAQTLCFESLAWSLPSIAIIFREMSSITKNIKFFINRLKPPLQQYTELLSSYRITRKVGAGEPDFLQYFKDAEDEDYTGFKNEKTAGVVDMSKTKINKKMAPGEIVAQCRFLSIAGFDTTANTLTLLFDLLAKNAPILTSLLEELNNVEAFDYQTVLSLHLLNNCILETLRLYPHASPLQHRRCMASIEIEDTYINEGVNVIMDTWTVHHDKGIWGDDVEEFNPARFNELSDLQKRAFMPFGGGPRQCIGMRFALLEMKATVCHLLKKYTILPKDTREKLKLSLRDTGTVWPDYVAIQLKKRRD